jgi:hypothetical protein
MAKQQRVHVGTVREWCASLGILAAANASRVEVEAKAAAFVPMLMQRFDDGAFTAASLEFVAARADKGFPTYGEVSTWLSEWWRENRPPPPRAIAPPRQLALPPEPPPEPPTEEEKAAVRARVQECIAILSSPRPAMSERSVQDQLSELGEATPLGPEPRYLTPEQLDIVNPLPDGRKRVPSLPSEQ